jgi:CRP/FNR family transcriptional regulator
MFDRTHDGAALDRVAEYSPASASAAPVRCAPAALRNWSARTSLADLLRITGASDLNFAGADAIYFSTRQIRPGAPLVCAGQTFHNLYVVLSGTLRASAPHASGVEHVVAFPMVGDVIGLDALADRIHPTSVSALDETCVAMLPYGDVQELRRSVPQFEDALLRSFSAELRREHLAKSNMGSLGAELRVVRFLLQQSERYAAMGYSSRRFRLRMTREDIASYLGLSLETVCRSFTLLARLGLITVCRRDVTLLDIEALHGMEYLRPSPGNRKPALHACAAKPITVSLPALRARPVAMAA